jgi:hypothetical protein
MVEHADKNARRLIGSVLCGKELGGVAEGFEEDEALDDAADLGEGIVGRE